MLCKMGHPIVYAIAKCIEVSAFEYTYHIKIRNLNALINIGIHVNYYHSDKLILTGFGLMFCIMHKGF